MPGLRSPRLWFGALSQSRASESEPSNSCFVFDCRQSLHLLLNLLALDHQEIEGFGVFKKEAVFEHPLIVTSQCIERISFGYEVEATV